MDGTEFFAEQSSHNPPITHYQFYGPKNLYILNGYIHFITSMKVNSLQIIYDGKKVFHFLDGSKIIQTLHEEWFYSTFIGTLRQLTLGSVNFRDEKNQLKATIDFGKCKNK